MRNPRPLLEFGGGGGGGVHKVWILMRQTACFNPRRSQNHWTTARPMTRTDKSVLFSAVNLVISGLQPRWRFRARGGGGGRYRMVLLTWRIEHPSTSTRGTVDLVDQYCVTPPNGGLLFLGF